MGTIRYLAKYMKKESTNLGYNKKRYFASANLNCAPKLLYDFTEEEKQHLADFCESVTGNLVKETKKAKYYEIHFNELEHLGLNEHDIFSAEVLEQFKAAQIIFEDKKDNE